MTNQELERRLSHAVEQTAPNDLEGVLARCDTQKGTVIPMKNMKTKKTLWRTLAAACMALVLLGAGGAFYQQSHAVASVISLDVNPSIELSVSKKETVLACTPLNADAQTVLAEMEGGAALEGVPLDVAVNAVVGALVRHGYFDRVSSALLISVEDADQTRAARLQQELTAAVDAVLQGQAASASVMTQTITQDAGLDAQARQSSISVGKAALVNQVLACNDALDFDALAALSVAELRQLLQAGAPDMPIGMDAAAQAAEEYAGTLAVDAVTTEVDAELDETPAHYEVELEHPTLGEYTYYVDAYTGAVLSGQPEILNASAQAQSTSLEEAKAIALRHAGVDAAAAAFTEEKQETEDGRACYELQFHTAGAAYAYTVDAATGAVVEWESEPLASAQDSRISREAALQAALAHAGLTAEQVHMVEIELDTDDGSVVYEVEFVCGRTEYQYTLDAETGAVLESETELDD